MRVRPTLVVLIAALALMAAPTLAQEDEVSAAPQWAPLQDGPWSSMGKGVSLMGPLTLADGSLVVVTTPFDSEFTAWVSEDGLTWTRSDPVDASGGMYGTDFVATHDGVAMIMIDPFGLRSSVFESVDGLEWSSWQQKNAAITGGGEAGGVTYLAGVTGKPSKLDKVAPAIWRRLDDGPYEQLSLKDVRKQATAWGVAALPTGELLVLTRTEDGLQAHRGTWDGDWETFKTPANKKDRLWYADLASTPEGAVLALKQKDSGIWFTADGTDWQLVAEPKGEFRITESRAALYTTPRVWMSTDGQTWCGLGRPGSGKHQATGVAPLADGGLFALGVRLTKNKKALRPAAFIDAEPRCVPLEPSEPEAEEAEGPTD